MILEPIWEADFSNRSYGFRPKRSTYDAISYLSNRLAERGGKTYQWVIEGDRASSFDTIPHRRLSKAIKKKGADRDIRALLWQFLRAGVMERGEVTETLTGTPQGGIVSPLLANIYLDHLDKSMESKYLHLTKDARAWRRKQGKGNDLSVRYADDFVVLCNGTKAEAHAMKEERHNVLDHMGLTLSEEKTKVTHITAGFTFLGYRIERSIGETGKMVPKVLVPQKAITKFRQKVNEMLNPRTAHDSLHAKIYALNGLGRGWCNSYRCTRSPSKIFGQLSHEISWEMVHWLGRKYQVNTPTILTRFLKGRSTFGTTKGTLVMPSSIKAKNRLVKAWTNPYTGTEMIEREYLFSYKHLWTGVESIGRTGRMDLREEFILLKGTRCAIQGPECASQGKPLHPSEVEMDHIIPRWKFKDPTEAHRMGNLQPVCTPCHRAKTKTDPKVLSRVR